MPGPFSQRFWQVGPGAAPVSVSLTRSTHLPLLNLLPAFGTPLLNHWAASWPSCAQNPPTVVLSLEIKTPIPHHSPKGPAWPIPAPLHVPELIYHSLSPSFCSGYPGFLFQRHLIRASLTTVYDETAITPTIVPHYIVPPCFSMQHLASLKKPLCFAFWVFRLPPHRPPHLQNAAQRE